jgi:hypothetical protein
MAMRSPGDERNLLNWRKSAYSISGGNCAEVASAADVIIVRDSQDPETLVLRYPAASWRSFLDAARTGRFDAIG